MTILSNGVDSLAGTDDDTEAGCPPPRYLGARERDLASARARSPRSATAP